MAVNIEATCMQSNSKFITLELSYGQKVTGFTAMQSRSLFKESNIKVSCQITAVPMESNSQNLLFNLSISSLIYLPAFEKNNMDSVSEFKVADILAQVFMLLNIDVINNTSKFLIPCISVNGNQDITAKFSKSKSEFLTPKIDIGTNLLVEVQSPMTSKSKIPVPKIRFNLLDSIKSDDDVYLLCKDENDKFKIYKAIIRKREVQNRRLTVKAIMGNGILSERIIREDYPEQDIGLTVKEIIETYCSPLTTSNIDTETGFIAPVESDGKRPLSVLEKLRKEYPVHYHTDHSWGFHFYLTEDIKATNWEDEENRQGYKIRFGDD